ncbi:MAG: divergent polysaccharide deacetylase family protein, partial [Verrucomicrobiia bacterium]
SGWAMALMSAALVFWQSGCKPNIAAADLPRLAVVLDDGGLTDRGLIKRLCKIPIRFSVAVLPGETHSVECAELAHRAGKEVMVHLPMEPLSKPAALYLGHHPIMFGMTEDEVRVQVRQHLGAVPHCAGVNNHMGSRITANRQRMIWILEEVKAKGLFFVDSRTTKDTVAYSVAKELGVPAAQRAIYLDNDKRFQEIQTQWQRAIASAGHDGQVLAIGHVSPETVAALEQLVPTAKGVVQFVTAGEIAGRLR